MKKKRNPNANNEGLKASGAADTLEARRRGAERYLEAAMTDMGHLPPEMRTQLKQAGVVLTKVMAEEMVKHFTTQELTVLADFYESPVEQRFAAFLVDLWPTMQAELLKAQANQKLPDQNQSPRKP